MMHDQGPKDGDFARYVERLSQHNPLAPTQSSTPDSRKNSTPESYKTDPATPNASPETNAETIASQDSKSAIAGIVRAILLAFLALFFIAPLVPEPFDVLIRVAAIIYVVYIIKRSQPALSQLRNKLAELKKQ